MELLTRPVGTAELQAGGAIQEFSLSSSELGAGAAGGSKGRVQLRESFPRVGFIVTNLSAPSRAVVSFYNKRGTAEQWIKESKQAVAMTRLSCHRFRANEVRLWLSLIAYNLGDLWRRLALRGPDRKVVANQLAAAVGENRGTVEKACTLLLAAAGRGHLTRRLFGGMLQRIAAPPSPAG